MAGKGEIMVTKKVSAEQTTENSIAIIRVFDTPPNIVFKSWTDPECVKQWFSPKSFTTPYCSIDLRVGGECLLCMRSAEGKDYWSKGVFREIIEPKLIIRTDTFSDEKGNIVSPKQYGMNNWPDETIVQVNFADYAGRTKLTIQHYPIEPGEERDMCRQGWNECLDKLADYLAEEEEP
jgi:uncharacterized protein YndB with AHSA1/START domain